MSRLSCGDARVRVIGPARRNHYRDNEFDADNCVGGGKGASTKMFAMASRGNADLGPCAGSPIVSVDLVVKAGDDGPPRGSETADTSERPWCVPYLLPESTVRLLFAEHGWGVVGSVVG